MRLNTFYFLAGIALAACPLSVRAQSATAATIPEGFVAFHLSATAPGVPSTTYISLPLANDPTYSGVVASATGTTITSADSPAPFVASALSSAASPYFVKFLTGIETGRILKITANTTTSLTLDTTDGSSQTVSLTASNFTVQPGDTYEIFAASTLGSVFGAHTTQSPLILQGGTAVTAADTVSVYNNASLTTQTYYFDTTSNFWKTSGSSVNANNTVLAPYSDVIVTRQGSESALTIVLSGRVAEVPVLTKIVGNNSVMYDSTGYATDITLSQLQFGSNWTKSTLPFIADTISVWNPAMSAFDNYYQLPDSTWRKSGYSGNQSNFVIAAGTQIAILKRGAVSGASSFLQTPMPYSIN